MNPSRIARIRTSLTGLAPQTLELQDESHLHAGHAGARDGKGHFRLRIVAAQFAGLGLIKRHQLVYRALDEMMRTDIHALSITALTPEEAREDASAFSP